MGARAPSVADDDEARRCDDDLVFTWPEGEQNRGQAGADGDEDREEEKGQVHVCKTDRRSGLFP